MNQTSQRSLNAGWTRHQNAARPQRQTPVTVTTFAGESYTGVAWVNGYTMDRAALHTEIKTARTAYQETGDRRVFTGTVILHSVGPVAEFMVALAFNDVKRISEVE